MKYKMIKALGGLLALLTATLATHTALAAGFYLSEAGTPGSLGTAGVANPTNTFGADSSWTNPAGMTGLQQDELLGGLMVLLPKVEFDSSIATGGGDDGGNAGDATAIPSLFYVNKVSDQLSLGFSIVGAMGGGVDYGDNFVGRYATQKAGLGAIALSPSIGFKVNDKLSLGAGVSVIYTIFEMDIATNPAVLPTLDGNDGQLKIEDATDWGYQPFFGLTYQISDRSLLGIVYRAEMDVELKGDVKTRNLPGIIGVDTINVEWDNPQWLEAGLRYKLDDRNTLFLNAGWQEWSAFSNNVLAFSGGILNPVATLDRQFDNTWHAGIALSHVEGTHGTSIGFSYDSSPVEDEHRTFDLPFDEIYKGAFSYFWKGNKNLDFALGGTIYLVGDASIDQTSQGVQAKGEFDKNYILFLGATARYHF
jgi:long-chain fatty acid transport protein